LIFLATPLATVPLCAAEPELTGEQIYANSCARCHGNDGAGEPTLEDGPDPLAGDLSVAQLADVIAETMPEDDPGTLTRAQAQAVAAYVHDAFYSSIARARNAPPRIELARLTVGQYRRTIADLIGSFGDSPWWSDQRGLSGDYFQQREPDSDEKRAFHRIDPEVNFDFGVAAPTPEIKEPHGFSIRWRGALRAAETGEYEIMVRTDHAARLWLNNAEVPLIDAWVKSGDQTEYSARAYLIGGRAYPLRLEFSKAKQGVDDSDKNKDKEPPPSKPAAIALLWRRPHGALQVIPARNLAASSVAESFACATPFPPDDRSYGWVRGTAVSKEWDAATTAAAIEAADYIAPRLNRLAGTNDDDDKREEKLRRFCRTLVERAFRAPLTDGVADKYVDAQFEAVDDLDAAVRRVLLMTLKSPRFLFREVGGGPDACAAAARLSFGLWNSLPDEPLRDAARDGRLQSPEQLREQAWRMVGDQRTRAKLHEFLLAWLGIDVPTDLRKNPEVYPDCDDVFFADLKTSLEMFLDEVLDSPEPDYRKLLLTDEVYLNDRLAKVYGVERPEEPSPAASGFAKVRLDDGQRAGILTHPYMMARFSHTSDTSPIHRGVFLARGMLGQTLKPPPEALAPTPAELHPDLTTRERVALQTEPAACMTCHRIINPLGFTLERFDAIGRYRDRDGNKPVDDVGAFQTSAGDTVPLHGARELAAYVAASDEGQAAFVEQLFHHLVQQPVEAYGPDILENLRRSFAEHDCNIRQLAVEIMVATAGVGRETNGRMASE
jgi:hypothetical protein